MSNPVNRIFAEKMTSAGVGESYWQANLKDFAPKKLEEDLLGWWRDRKPGLLRIQGTTKARSAVIVVAKALIQNDMYTLHWPFTRLMQDYDDIPERLKVLCVTSVPAPDKSYPQERLNAVIQHLLEFIERGGLLICQHVDAVTVLTSPYLDEKLLEFYTVPK